MLISLSILPIYLLLLHDVTSEDFSSNKKVAQENTQVIRTYYDVNHPPIVETYETIPVAVVYDDEEVIKVRNKNGRKTNVGIEDEKKSLIYATSGSESIHLEDPPGTHPPSRGLYPYAEVDDYKEELNLKPRARSIKIPVTESDETKTPEKPYSGSGTRSEIRPRKRVQKVRKVKVDKSQINVNVNESEMTENKVAQKEATTTDKIRSDEQPVPTLQYFKQRKGLRDPVVPIIESESYVFSHSGDFHYSYEGGDGTKAYERGVQKVSNGSSGSAVEGNYSYKDKDGNDVSLSYTADENGYRPVGAHLPTPPPIPPAIQRALAYLATKTTPEPITERVKTL